ncbi:MAG: hypothetical protein JO134_11760 [Xanthobacteraceae bacterium]|nr:hypothetical protein [Xanthobacteraceae bacterium]
MSFAIDLAVTLAKAGVHAHRVFLDARFRGHDEERRGSCRALGGVRRLKADGRGPDAQASLASYIGGSQSSAILLLQDERNAMFGAPIRYFRLTTRDGRLTLLPPARF